MRKTFVQSTLDISSKIKKIYKTAEICREFDHQNTTRRGGYRSCESCDFKRL